MFASVASRSVDHGQAHQHQAEGGEGSLLDGEARYQRLGQGREQAEGEAEPRHQPVKGRVAQARVCRTIDDDEQDDDDEGNVVMIFILMGLFNLRLLVMTIIMMVMIMMLITF